MIKQLAVCKIKGYETSSSGSFNESSFASIQNNDHKIEF